MNDPTDLLRVAAIGIGATAAMDLWLLLLRRFGIPTLDMALIGRWTGHGLRGRWTHAAIAKAEPVRAETAIGWTVHYLTGIVFAGVLVALHGIGWAHAPSLAPALCTGLLTVLAPWLLMQPAMGAGIAASNTPSPWRNRLRSMANHIAFGAGLYAAAALIVRVS